ncbi:MAG: glycosyltransferase family 4 protein [Candidatus Sumerlaeia bacterium]|nr:glycosyltransferase family 4 protein [Candidatus Sumerlaeia bacterium]
MRLLLVNQYYAPDCAATAQVLADACEDLVRAGHEVHVVAGRARYDGADGALPGEEVLHGVHVQRVGGTGSRRGRYRDRLLGYTAFHASLAGALMRVPRPDAAIFLTTPPLVGVHGRWLRALRGVPYALWVMDVYPEIVFRSGLFSPRSAAGRAWSALATAELRGADRVVALCGDMAEVLARRGVSRERFEVVPCWADGAEIRPAPLQGNPFRRREFPRARFLAAYSGNAGTCHCFDAVVEGIRLLRARPDAAFAFIGGGKRYDGLRRDLAPEGDRVRFLPYQPRAELRDSLTAPDAHIVTLDPRYDGLLLPSKVFGVMAAGRPILFVGSATGTVGRLLRDSGCGIVVDPADGAAFARAVERLADDPGEAAAMGARGRARFEAEFHRPLATARLRAVFESMAPSTAPIPADPLPAAAHPP